MLQMGDVLRDLSVRELIGVTASLYPNLLSVACALGWFVVIAWTAVAAALAGWASRRDAGRV